MPKLPVDTAIEVIVGPLISNIDFKSQQLGVPFNAAGMSIDLLEKGVNSSTKTDITLTTAGANDWVELGSAYYSIEITAAQNNTEGTLQVVGVKTGALPFESPVYEVVAIAVYNSLVQGSDNLSADVLQWNGVNVPAPTVGGVPRVELNNAAHGGAAAVLTLERLIVTATTSNEPAVKLTGVGTGEGLELIGGITGPGMRVTGGATLGEGILVEAIGSSGAGLKVKGAGSFPGIQANGGPTGHGIKAAGSGVGSGISAEGGATGVGLDCIGGLTSGDALRCTVTSGIQLNANITGNLTGNLTGNVTGSIGSLGATAKADVNTEVDASMVTYGLDHLLFVSVAGTDVADNSIMARMVSKAATADWDTFVNTTDSLEAIRDRGDTDWITGSGTGLTPLASGTAQSGTASTIVLAASSTFGDGILDGNVIKITSGTGAGQARYIDTNTLADDTCNVKPNWTTNPDATSVYEIVDAAANVIEIEGGDATAALDAAAGPGVLVGPIVAVQDVTNRVSAPVELGMHQHEDRVFAILVLDANGVAVSLVGKTLRFVVHTNNEDQPQATFEVESAGITISGSPVQNLASVSVSAAQSVGTLRNHRWELWDDTGGIVLAHGPFSIQQAVRDIP